MSGLNVQSSAGPDFDDFRFFTGLHQPSDAQHFDAAFISVNRLRQRRGPFAVGDWILDSGAFTEISRHNHYRHSVADYAAQIRRWSSNGNLIAAVAQDWMCEPWILTQVAQAEGIALEGELNGETFLSGPQRRERVRVHQQRTIERFDELLTERPGAYIMPVLQGYRASEYVDHIRQYGPRLARGQWVGVGSVCKRNGDIAAVVEVLLAIHAERPDLRLHGFGLKTTALSSSLVTSMLTTADSMAWSFHARKNGRNANDWREAKRWTQAITDKPRQHVFDFQPRGLALSSQRSHTHHPIP